MKQKKKRRIFSLLLGNLDHSLLGNLLTGKAAIVASQGRGTVRAGEGKLRASENF